MGFKTADITAAQGYYLVTGSDPRISPGLNFGIGACVVWGKILLQKQSSSPTDWTAFQPEGGGGGSWGAPSSVITRTNNTAIPPATSLVKAQPTSGALVIPLPAPAAATQAIAVVVTDVTHTVSVSTPSGVIGAGGGSTFPLKQILNAGNTFISDGTNWFVL